MTVQGLIDELQKVEDKNMIVTVDYALEIDSIEEKGMCILNKIIPLSDALRAIADKMEHYISVDNLSLPSYEKLFFNIDY